MLKKLKKRLIKDSGMLSNEANLTWLKAHCSDFSTLASALDPKLWEESESVSEQLKQHAKEVLDPLGYDFWGPAIYPFLYFITRFLEPDCIVETGVAAGFSSSVFLTAIRANAKGRLYSSDFPYFRLPNPDRLIGIVVEEALKANWELYIDGDETNLPKILARISTIDIFHYDSDKSYSGMKYAIQTLEGKMSKTGIILIDDVEGNSFFHDNIQRNHISEWRVFEYQGKFIGMIGELTRRSA